MNDEKRKMCERFEDYVEKIRTRALRFTPEANSVKIYDIETKENISLPSYVGRRMAEYDRDKVKEAECRCLDESFQSHEENEPFLRGDPYPTTLEIIMETRFLIARNTLSLIDEALTSPTPLIEEGEAFFRKLEECEKERKSLADEKDRTNAELQELSAEVVSLGALYEECQRKLHIKPV